MLFTKIIMENGLDTCDIFTNQSRMLRRMRKLHSLFPDECRFVETTAMVEHWRCPFWWFNCRKRDRPQPYSKPIMNKTGVHK